MFTRKQMQTYSTAKPSSDSILRIQKCSGIEPVKVYRLQKPLGIPRKI